jgi:hypothetical protein
MFRYLHVNLLASSGTPPAVQVLPVRIPVRSQLSKQEHSASG